MNETKIDSRLDSLRALYEALSEEHRVELSYELDRATTSALRIIASKLSPEQLAKALEAARRIDNQSLRAETLSELAPFLSNDQVGEALKAAEDLEDEQDKARGVCNLAKYLSQSQLDEALRIASGIGNEGEHANVLRALGQYLSLVQIAHALTDAENKVKEESLLMDVLADLAAGLAQNKWTKELEAVDQVVDLSGDERTKAHQEVERVALKIVRQIKNEAIAAHGIRALLPYLSSKKVSDALNSEKDQLLKARLTGILSLMLPPNDSGLRLNQGLDNVEKIKKESVRAQALGELAPYLSGEHREQAVDIAIRMKSDSECMGALDKIIDLTPKQEIRRVLRERVANRLEKIALKNSAHADEVAALRKRIFLEQERTVSVMMPFGGDEPYWKRFYKLHYQRLKENFELVDVKHNNLGVKYSITPFYTAVHSIPLEGLKQVVQSDILVSLVSHKNINVIYETGIREVIKGGVIRLVEGVPGQELPVYLSHQGFIPYETPNKTEVGKAIEAMAQMEFSDFILSEIEPDIGDQLRAFVHKHDKAFREQLQSALQEIEDTPPGEAAEILTLFREVPPSRIVATWNAYFPYSVIRVKWKRMSGKGFYYTKDDLEAEPVVCAANRAFMDLFDVSRMGAIPDPDGPRPLTQTALAKRLEEEGYVAHSTFEAFIAEQGSLLERLVFHCDTDWATMPLRLDGDKQHPYYDGAHFLPAVIAKWTIGDRNNNHEQYFLIAYVRLDHDHRNALSGS